MDGLENGKAMAITLIHVVEGKRKAEIDSTLHLAISLYFCLLPVTIRYLGCSNEFSFVPLFITILINDDLQLFFDN